MNSEYADYETLECVGGPVCGEYITFPRGRNIALDGAHGQYWRVPDWFFHPETASDPLSRLFVDRLLWQQRPFRAR
jgi:hypothetical protein